MKRKQFFSALLCAMMVMTLLPTPALAAGAVAEIVGGAQYATVQEAIDAATSGATIRLLDNVSLQPEAGGPYTLSISAINLTIDLNGKTITGMGPTAIEYDGTAETTLYIKDNSASGGGTVSSAYSSPITSTGNVTILGGTVISSNAPVISAGGDSTLTVSGGIVRHANGNSPVIIATNVIISGGTVEQPGYSPAIISTNVTVSGGTVRYTDTSGSSPAIIAAYVTVSGGMVASGGTVTTISADNVTVSGGRVENTGTGQAISATTISVSGGTVRSSGNITITSGGTVTVTGGTVLNTGANFAIGASNVIISGGSINSIPPVIPKNAATPPVEVKLYTLVLAGVSSETAVTRLTLTPALGYTYGLMGVTTDASGKLYVWLPDAQSAASVSVTANGKTYTGTLSAYAATLNATDNPDTSSYDPSYPTRTLADGSTGLTVSGTLSGGAALHVNSFTPARNTADPAFAAIRKRMDSTTDKLIFCADITISGNYSGPLTLSFEVGDQYSGQTVTLLHVKDGTLITYTAIVINGIATFTVTSLSPFALFAPALNAVVLPNTGDGGTSYVTIAVFGILTLVTGMSAVHIRRRYKKEKAN